MRDPNYRPLGDDPAEVRPPGAEEALRDITRDPEAFTAAIRVVIFTFLQALAGGEVAAALATLTSDAEPWTADRLRAGLDAYLAGHARIRLDPAARNRRNTYVLPAEDKKTWRVQQVLVDPEDANDWMAEFEVDLPASKAAEAPVIRLLRVEAIGT